MTKIAFFKSKTVIFESKSFDLEDMRHFDTENAKKCSK